MLQLILDTSGLTVDVYNGCFRIRSKNQKRIISPKKIESILITNNVQLNSSAILLATKNQIVIVFTNRVGSAVCSLKSANFENSGQLRFNQYKSHNKNFRLLFAREIVQLKFSAQVQMISKLISDNSKEESNLFHSSVKDQLRKIALLNNDLKLDALSILRGHEGNVSRKYWILISSFLPISFQFESRSRQPAKDVFNAGLNYGYGMLYNFVEEKCLSMGLDPQIGFYHDIQYGKPVLAFDFIEVFRHYWDYYLISLIVQDIIQLKHFDQLDKGCYLNKSGKQILIPKFYAFLKDVILFNGKSKSLRAHLFQYIQGWQQKILNNE